MSQDDMDIVRDRSLEVDISSTTEIVNNFFYLDEKDHHLLVQEEVLTALLARVTFFHDTLLRSGELYAVLHTTPDQPYVKSIDQESLFMVANAQAFLREILFGKEEKVSFSAESVKNIQEKIHQIFDVISHEKASQVAYKLKSMLTKASYEQEDVSVDSLEDHLISLPGFLDRLLDKELSLMPLHSYPESALLSTIKNELLSFAYNTYLEHREYYGLNRRLANPTLEEFTSLLERSKNILESVEAINTSEQKLKEIADSILAQDTPDSEIDVAFGEQLAAHFEKFSVEFKSRTFAPKIQEDEEGYRKYLTVNKDNLLKTGWRGDFSYTVDGITIDDSRIKDIIMKYHVYRSLKYFDKEIGKADFEQIEKDKQRVGAKGAYLRELLKYLDKIKIYKTHEHDEDPNMFLNADFFSVPEFEEIEIEHYKLWKATGKLDDNYMKPLYEKRVAKHTDIILRSSALYSEDNEINTGAGIYSSEKIAMDALTYETFCETLIKIYESCDAPHAIKYRQDNNIPEEYMGVVVQAYKEGQKGYSNSIMPHRPELMEVIFEDENTAMRPIVVKDLIREHLFSGRDVKNVLHYNIDTERGDRESKRDMVWNATTLTSALYLLERYFRKISQLEFVICKEEGSIRNRDIHVVQLRPLPVGLAEKFDISFPQDKEPLWEGKALGACDEEYDMLTTGENNNDKIGAVLFSDTQFGSLNEKFIEDSLPKKGVVIVKRAVGFQGHIETICAEKGITCLFPEGSDREYNTLVARNSMMNYHMLGLNYTRDIEKQHADFDGHKRIRVVADGLLGKIYPID